MIANHETFGARLGSSELIYNLSDVEKFLPKVGEDGEWATEHVTRKRKERQDSGSSSVQERKVIRSNSEERTVDCPPSVEENIRRVSSHEDFEKCKRQHHYIPPLHEQNYDKCPSTPEFDSFYLRNGNKSGDRSSTDFFCPRQKYSKNDSSPSRSRIHEYILFPKRISPNRDPNVDAAVRFSGHHSGYDERDHERARCNERRSRTAAPRIRRGPPRRQAKQRPPIDIKENLSKDGAAPFVHNKDAFSLNSKKSETITLTGEKSNYQSSFQTKEDTAGGASCSSQKYFRDRSQSPFRNSSPNKKSPIIDLSTLHEHLGQNEPIPSIPRRLMGFPWDSEDCQTIPMTLDTEPLRDENVVSYDKKDISNIREQRRTLPDKCEEKSVDGSGSSYSIIEPDERLNKIAKKLQVIKKKIAKCEADFEVSHGYRASHADKMNNEDLRKLYSDMRRLKNERKTIKAGPGESLTRPIPTETLLGESLKNKPMVEIMVEIERRLDLKRTTHNRPEKLEECTYMQLAEEKAAVQRALLWLEGARGRPTDKNDRDAARPLYDRYRAVKRMVAKYETAKANSNIGELATIMEHEPMLFNNLDSPIESPDINDKPNQSDSGTSTTDISERKDGEDPTSSSAKSTASDETTVESMNITNENLHCLPLSELNKLFIETKNLKISLRKNIKQFESEFEVQNSRKILKDERQTVLPSYFKYKETKARLRLLNALINKQKKSYG